MGDVFFEKMVIAFFLAEKKSKGHSLFYFLNDDLMKHDATKITACRWFGLKCLFFFSSPMWGGRYYKAIVLTSVFPLGCKPT